MKRETLTRQQSERLAALVDDVKESASLTDLHDFGGDLLANPAAIDAVVRGGNLIDGEPIEEHAVAVVLRSGKVVVINGDNESRELFHAMKRGVL